MPHTSNITKNKGICEEHIFNKVYTHNLVQLRNYLYYKCGEMELAEDITQQAFLKVWEKCRDIFYDKARGYLFAVAKRLFLGKVKSDKVALKFIKDKTEEVNNDNPENVLISTELRKNIEQSISELPGGQREVFLMNRIDKLTYREIAQVLDISETAVEKRMSKALLKLRDRIEEFKQYNI